MFVPPLEKRFSSRPRWRDHPGRNLVVSLDPPELPTLTQSVLDEATLQSLISDLLQCTQILELTTKGGEQLRAQKEKSQLPELVAGLKAGAFRGLQIRYLWEEKEWIDTLLATPEGLRLIRIEQPGG